MATSRSSSRFLRPSLLLAAIALSAGCSGETESPEDTSLAEDTASSDAAADAGDSGIEDAGAEDVSTLPEYTRVSCDERESADAPRNGFFTWTPPACEYEVNHPHGITNIVESCGEAVDLPEALHLTFPNIDAGRNVAVSWMTPPTTRETVVRLGTSPDDLSRVYWGHNFDYTELYSRGLIHEVHLCGLEPGTTYYYQAGGEGAWSDVYSFATAPDPDSDEEIVFAVTGDTRSDTFEMWGDAVEQMRERGAEFIVFSGDAVPTGGLQAQWNAFFSQGQPGMAEMPFVPCNGNHDLLLSPYFGQFALPDTEGRFSLRYGPLHFVSMTDFDIATQRELPTVWTDFIDASYAANEDALWKFLLNHRAFYSASNHGSMADIQKHWGPIVDKYEVDIVFNGHDHNYERTHPIRDGQVVAEGEGTIYTVVGAVGAPLYNNGSDWWTAISEKTEAYAIVRVTPEELKYTAYRLDGTVLDELTLSR